MELATTLLKEVVDVASAAEAAARDSPLTLEDAAVEYAAVEDAAVEDAAVEDAAVEDAPRPWSDRPSFDDSSVVPEADFESPSPV